MLESTTTLASLDSASQSGFNNTLSMNSLQQSSLAQQSKNSNFVKNYSHKSEFEPIEESTASIASMENKKVKMMIIDNLLNFISSNLDKKLGQIEGLVEKNKRNLKKA